MQVIGVVGNGVVIYQEGGKMVHNPLFDKCMCGHMRVGHEEDCDWDGERRIPSYGECETVGCRCEEFELMED